MKRRVKASTLAPRDARAPLVLDYVDAKPVRTVASPAAVVALIAPLLERLREEPKS